MRKGLELGLTAALVVTALAVVVSAVVGSQHGATIARPEEQRQPEFVKEWREALRFATRVAGPPDAPISILALSDLECPVCRGFHQAVLNVIEQRPAGVQLLYVHYPLSYHRAAFAAARGAECAEAYEPGSFGRWIDAVYAKQDSLARRPWREYASDAQLTNPERIEICVSRDPQYDTKVFAGMAFGDGIGVEGTPTVLVNGWRYFRTPSANELLGLVDSLLIEVAGGI